MKWFQKRTAPRAAEAQLRDAGRRPFGLLEGCVPLGGGEIRLYRAVREAVPVVDAAVYKLIRMVSGVTAVCGDKAAERELREFLRTVPAGRGQYGLGAFLDGYLDSLLTCGRAVGEIVPAAGNRDIAAVLWGNVEDVEIREGDTPLDFTVCGPDRKGRMGPLPYQDLILFTPLNPEAGNPYGVSLLRGLPFLADILMEIYGPSGSTGSGAEACGSPSPAGTAADRRRSGAASWPESGPGPCRMPRAAASGTSWLSAMWISGSSAPMRPSWTARCRCGRSWSRWSPRRASRPLCWD